MRTESRRRVSSLAGIIALSAASTIAVLVAPATDAVAAPPRVFPATVLAAGYNASGQLGLGTTANSPTFTPVHGDFFGVASGASHTLAVGGSNDAVDAWGDNTYGQLGNGTYTSSQTPVHTALPPAGDGYAVVAAGAGFSAALNGDGLLWIWGRGNVGELGVGAIGNVPYPIHPSLPAGTSIARISAGYEHVLALSTTGIVYAWGLNNYGQLGDGTTTNRLSPVVVHLPAGVTATEVSAGYAHSLIRTSDGDVYAFGRNNRGQLGTGTLTDSATPVKVFGLTATTIAAGGADSLALTPDGTVESWGDNAYGELGVSKSGSVLGYSDVPLAVDLTNGHKITTISAGYAHNLMITTDNTVLAFGDNTYGQLGLGAVAGDATPTEVTLHPGIRIGAAITGPASLSSAIAATRITPTVTVTSSSSRSALGRPVAVTATVAPVDGGTLAFSTDGNAAVPGCGAVPLVHTTGSEYTGTCVVAPTAPGDGVVTATFAGDAYHYGAQGAVVHDNGPAGAALGWGWNSSSQLGTGGGTVVRSPVAPQLPDGTKVVSIASDHVHGLAATASGAVYAWGDNTYGEVGDGTTTARHTPVPVSLPSGVQVIAVAAGGYTSLALSSTGTVYAWGLNNYGQLGNGSTTRSTTPVGVTFPAGVSIASVSAGYAHNLAVTASGGVYSWGLNNVGQLGTGTTIASASTPRLVALPSGAFVTSVSAGYAHSLATTLDGGVLSWGENVDGELGNGTTTRSNAPVPVLLPAGIQVVEVSAGFHASLALLSGGGVLAWGLDNSGQLGNGTTSNSSTPVVVGLPTGTVATNVVTNGGASAALTSAGSAYAVYTWGDNTYGELGTGSPAARSTTPVRAALPSGGVPSALGSGPYSLSSFAIVAPTPTTTTVTVDPISSTFGQLVTITATVHPSGGTGTVKFSLDATGNGMPGCDAVALTPGPDGDTAVCTSSTIPIGQHLMAVFYSGDAFHQASVNDFGNLHVIVNAP